MDWFTVSYNGRIWYQPCWNFRSFYQLAEFYYILHKIFLQTIQPVKTSPARILMDNRTSSEHEAETISVNKRRIPCFSS